MRITVLMGGTSAERDVSLASGARVAEALRSRGHEVTAIDPAAGVISASAERKLGAIDVIPPSLESLGGLMGRALAKSLVSQEEIRTADVVFLALHGGWGEDGSIQSLLDLMGVRYTGSGALASALAMDKDLSKRLFRSAGVGTADWMMAPVDYCDVEAKLGLPVIVKPSKQGSTVGLTLVKEFRELRAAVDTAFRYDSEVMIEQFVPGRELTVAVLGDTALPVGEIIPKKEIYDYECKYTPGMAIERFPAELDARLAAEVQEQALAVFRVLKLRGYARIDFRLTEEGDFRCLEANTLPGMTTLSLVPQAAAAAGIEFPELCERIVDLALN